MTDINSILHFIKSYDGPPIQIMEVCGTHTNSIFKYAINTLISSKISLISGPGCPVCVTPASYIDKAAEIALQKNTTLYTFGDMIKVPGIKTSLSEARAMGANVEIMYSPFEVLDIAICNPDKNYCIAAVGFETTIATYVLLIEKAIQMQVKNIKFLTSLKTIMPALGWICDNNPSIDGFLAPGHVSVILGSDIYTPFCDRYHIPLAICGFTGEQILAGIYDLIVQCQFGRAQMHNLYQNVVSSDGNTAAQKLIDKYFKPEVANWRGLGSINGSGLFLKEEYAFLDAGSRDLCGDEKLDNSCLCGNIIMGKARPLDCPLFGNKCSPLSPIGPCMVSNEGTCGIWYRNGVRNK